MATPIIPRLVRGRLYFEIGPVLLPTFEQAATAWSAAEAHRLDIAETPLRRCEDCRLVRDVNRIVRDALNALGQDGVK